MSGAAPEPPTAFDASALCQSCGACCAYSAEWPRFTLEPDEQIDRLPEAFVATGGMRCEGDRCLALQGEIGVATACTVYADRPDVCRACMPGDPECLMARTRYGFSLDGLVPPA